MSGDAMLVWGLALIAVGVLLMVLEAFIPSGGIIAMVSGVCAVAAIVLLFRVSATWGLIGLLLVAVLGPTSFFFALSMLPQTPIGRALLGAPSEAEVEAQELAELEEEASRAALQGVEAVTVTDLRPVGEIKVDGERLEATAQTGMIDAGTRVVVVSVDSNHIRVRPLT